MIIDKMKIVESLQHHTGEIDPRLFVVALTASLLSSLVAGALYRIFYERRGTGSQINRAFPLLGISITTLFIGVQVSLPLSLGLLGALSIIRFRTPIKEPEEVGFIMLVIASAITCATFNFQFLVIMHLMAVLTLVLLKGAFVLKSVTRDGIVVVTVAGGAPDELITSVDSCVKRHSRRYFLESSSCKDGLVSLQFSFAGLRTGMAELQADLGRVKGLSSVNVFFNRPGGAI